MFEIYFAICKFYTDGTMEKIVVGGASLRHVQALSAILLCEPNWFS